MKHYTDDDLVDYLHGELGDAADVLAHAHLAECTDCRRRLDAEAAVGEMLRSSTFAHEREFPSMIRAQVWASIRASEPSLLERIQAFFSPAVAVPLAAFLALLLYFGVPVLRSVNATGAPTVSALYYLDEHAALGQENPLADHMNTNTTLVSPTPSSIVSAPLIGAADAATLDDLVATRE